MSKRIGIYAGAFDPVHKGHVSFALQAIELAGLDEVAFVPEPRPRNKAGVTHLSHRIAMLRLAVKGHPKLKILEVPDKQFLVATSLPRLRAAIERLSRAQKESLAATVARRYGLAGAEEVRAMSGSLSATALVARLDAATAAVLKDWPL